MEWRQAHTHGTEIPILGKGSSSAVHGKHLYIFGGLDDEDYRNDLYQLDLDDLTWTKMPSKGVPPCPRSYGGMVVHGECLVAIGGIGKPLKTSGLLPSNHGGEVVKDEKFGGEFESEWNNYIHEYSTVTGNGSIIYMKGIFTACSLIVIRQVEGTWLHGIQTSSFGKILL